MERLKVLVVDDSALFRTLIRNTLHDIPDCEVIGTASDGRTAVEKIAALRPDLVTLDVEMPAMDGIEVLEELKRRKLRTRVVMVSRLTSDGARITTDALLHGAFDFILKPSSSDVAANRAELQAALEEKIASIRESRDVFATVSPPPAAPLRRPPGGVQAVIVGSSTGGPDALGQILPFLGPHFPIPIVIVQHMPERFTATLAQRLNEASELEVLEAENGLALQPGRAILACGGRQLKLERTTGAMVVSRLTDDPPEHNCRPAVDYTIRSALEAIDGPLLSVILTGMGRDGTEGSRLIRERGGQVIAQAADGCVVFGMPKSVINAGLADQILPLTNIPQALESLRRGGRG